MQRVVLLALAVFSVWHAAAIYFEVAPDTPLREAVPYEALRSYANPMFRQTWSVFAPDPVRGDYVLWVRAEMKHEGDSRITEWVNATEAEYTLAEGTPIRPRAAITSSIIARDFSTAFYRLTEKQKKVTTEAFSDGKDWAVDLKARIQEDGAAVGESPGYLWWEWRATAYATQVAKTIWGDGVIRVQYRAAQRLPVPFESREDPKAVPTSTTIDTGWRRAYEPEGVNSAAFAEVFRAAYDRSVVNGAER